MMFQLMPIWFLSNVDNSTPKASQESEQWPGYSLAFHLLLPVAGVCIIWGRRDILSRLLLQIDRNCISVCCPSLSKREKLLKWAGENLPRTWSSPLRTLSGGIPDLWKDGSLLCTLINMAIPGACSNPPKHWKKSPMHAQALAYKYFGIVPVFTDSDFNEPFSASLEQKFLTYLSELQEAIKSHCTEEGAMNISSDYLAKGMGLHNAEQHRKATFYIYSNTTNSNCNNILVYIRGPYGTQGTATIPAFHNLNSIPVLNYLHKQFKASDKIVYKKEARRSFLKSIALDFTSFVNLDKKVQANDTPIHVEMEFDRVKIEYIPTNFGIYEVSLVSNGENISGSPFLISVSENLSERRDSFESAEKLLKEIPAVRSKRIISRFIDCEDEQILLNNLDDPNNNRRNFENKIASVSVVTDSGNSTLSTHNEFETLPHAVIQYECPKISETKPQYTMLEKIHENEIDNNMDSNEDNISNDELTENNTIASIKPFCQSEDFDDEFASSNVCYKIKHFEENGLNDAARNLKNLVLSIVDNNRKNVTPLKEDIKRIISSLTSSLSGEKNEKRKLDSDEIPPKKPTSIVSPFLKTNNIQEQNKINTSELEKEKRDNILKEINFENTIDSKHKNHIEAMKEILIDKMNIKTKTKIISLKLEDPNNNNPKPHKPLASYFTNNKSTSPICPAHIAPEVDLTPRVSVSERRKQFKRQSCLSLPTSVNSSVSGKENEKVYERLRGEKYELQVLSVIETIKNSTNNKTLGNEFSKSVPNISNPYNSEFFNSENIDFKSSFHKIKDFWKHKSVENFSSSSSLKENTESTISPPRNILKYHKSADDMFFTSKPKLKTEKLFRCYSLNPKDFESIEFVSIEETKKKLLQDKYEQENLGSRFIKRNLLNKEKQVENLGNVNRGIPPNERKIIGNNKNEPEINATKSSSQFKRAITFFQNLENPTTNKHWKLKKKLKQSTLKRRFSLDFFDLKKENNKIGGSLRLPKSVERFSIAKIYFGIMESRK